MYIPNFQKNIKYYEQIAKGNHKLHDNNQRRKTIQTGGYIGRKSVGFMDNIDVSTPRKDIDPPADVNVQVVSPTQQYVEQVKSEIARKLNQRRKYKRRKNLKKVKSKSKRRRTGSGKRKTSKVKANKKKKHLLKKKKQSQKKKSFNDICN